MKKLYISGLKAGAPIIPGFIPIGIAYAVMAKQAGFTSFQTILMSATVFAGASQMMACGLYGAGAGIIAIIIATFMLNLRHFIMSCCVMDRMSNTNLPLRLLCSFGVTDESFAIFTTKKNTGNSAFFFLGLITVTYTSWVAGAILGVFVSDILPLIFSLSLGIALYAMFLGIIIPNLKGNCKLAVLAAITAIVNTFLNRFISSSQSLIISTLVCAGIGMFFVDLPDDTEA
jgi:4-azaleucine resistance transporter AzlC